MKSIRNRKRAGFSLMELLAVVTILGIIAAIIVPRVAVSSDPAKTKVTSHNKATINAAVERWYIEKGAWPANNLSNIGADVNYFPDGIPTNPTNGTAYTMNAFFFNDKSAANIFSLAVKNARPIKSRNRKRAGFSLMELLAVVTILGIIAAIIVPRV